jgi:hypothetical protein
MRLGTDETAKTNPLRWDAAIGVAGAFGEEPRAALSAFLAIGVRIRSVSVHLEGRGDLPAGFPVDGGEVSASSAWLTVAPCAHKWLLGLCALGTVGEVIGKGQLTDSSFAASAGARALLELPVPSFGGVRVGGDAIATLHGTRLLLDGHEVWSTPPFGAVVWASAFLNFE